MSQREGLEAGTRVGDYVLDVALGAGAFGTVYRGIEPVIGKLVAIKVLRTQDPEATTRFLNEARAVNAIRHPNVVDVFAFGRLDDGRHYLVMEWLEGEPLSRYIERHVRIPPESILPLLWPLAGALDAAHDAQIIHRDLKPSNVFLARAGNGLLVPKLLDFGAAKLADPAEQSPSGTATNAAIGTPMYMSPEQCRGPEIDHRSDIYALGALVFRLLTGELLFNAASGVEVMMMHLQTPARAPSSVGPGLPSELDASILAMLRKTPEDRPASATEALDGFRHALESIGLRTDAAPPPAEATESRPIAVPLELPSSTTATAVGPARWARALVAAALGVGTLYFLVQTSKDVAPVAPPPQRPAARAPAQPTKTIPAPQPTVRLSFLGLPTGTLVLDADGTLLGRSPGPIVLPQGEQASVLQFEKRGYVTKTSKVLPDADKTVKVQLSKIKVARPKHKDSVENPY